MQPAQTSTKKLDGARLQVAGLFSGIGGLELGLKRAGHETTLLCEIDKAARVVLNKQFPDLPVHEDVRTLKNLPAGTDLVTAGFPCQDLSQAGKVAGIWGHRSGLVSEVFRLIEKSRTPWVLLENVSFMRLASKGRAMESVLSRLEALGYKWAYRTIDSRAFGLPQRRQRIFILASREDDPRARLLSDDAKAETVDTAEEALSPGRAYGFYWTEGSRGLGWAVNAIPTLKSGSALGIASPPGILLPSGRVVKPDIRDAERMQGFPTNWTSAANGLAGYRKTLRWALVGNAVTVDVAEWIGCRLRDPKPYDDSGDELHDEGGCWPKAAWSLVPGERHTAAVGEWPVRRQFKAIHDFLKYPGEPLSEKATAGFLSRAKATTRLNIPKGFLEAIAAHLSQLRRVAVAHAP